MTPLVSWLVVGVVLLIAVVVYAAAVAGGRADEWNERTWEARMAPVDRFRPELDAPYVRVLPSVYDWQAHGDFEHDPIRDHEWCDGCATLLRHALNRIGDRHMGPRSADDLVAAIREELEP
jgi:hypothetical protein